MLDIGFSEMAVIGVVALIVIGPERLPKVARTAGILLGRAQRYVADIKQDINRQIQFEELKKLQEELVSKTAALESSMKQEVASVESQLNDTVAALTQSAQAVEEEVVELYRGEPALDPVPPAPRIAAAEPPPPPPESTPGSDAAKS